MHLAIESELAYLCSRGGKCVPYSWGTHVRNDIVDEFGDHNSFIVNSSEYIDDALSFARSEMERIGKEGATLQVCVNKDELDEFNSINSFWFSSKVSSYKENIQSFTSSNEEYFQWYEDIAKSYSDFSEEWWRMERESHTAFISSFVPQWFINNGTIVARMNCYESKNYSRLFSVVVEKQYRRQGYGRIAVENIIEKSVKPVFIRAPQRLRKFYEANEFKVCAYTATIST